MIRNLSTLLLICISPILYGQIAFTNASDKLANQFVNSGAAMGVADMNGDGLDDIIRLHSTTQLVIDEQTTSGTFRSIVTGINSPLSVWSLCIGDVDRNGGNDVFLGTANHFHRMAWSNNNEDTYTEQELDGPPILPQASNMADINNDGNLDLFVCNDNGINLPYLGDGKDLFFDPSLMNTATTPESDNSGNYGSVWVDYDNDRDLDLYVSKCRLGILDPMDPRRVNQLFENDGKGNYTEVAQSKGLVPFAQSWATDFGDIDNDGDLDAFMLNHDKPSILYENDGNGNFTDITAGAGFSPTIDNHGLGIQVKMVDFDNDTFLDILITSSQGGFRCFRNNGNKTFTPIFSAFQTLDKMQSFAVGDLNNDGYVDVIGGFGKFFNTPTETFDKLFLNDGAGNNWIKINLQGTNSNINGIGARVELHGPWGVMLREIRSGESYGISNALSAHFGLGGATAVESIVIHWPSGYTDTINNPGINQVHVIEEGGCISPPDTFVAYTICEGETLSFEEENYTEAGLYSYNYLLPEGCDSTIIIDIEVLPSYDTYTPFSVCNGSIIPLPDGTSQVITQNETFSYVLNSSEGCDSVIVVDISVLPTFNSNESFTICQGETYTWPDGTSAVILDSQSYSSSLLSEFNCDSIVVTSLNVTPAPNSQEYLEVCRGENYTFPDGNTVTINDALIYDITYPIASSCDSIANFIVDLAPEYNIVMNDVACRGGDYTFPDGVIFVGLTQDFSYTSFLQTTTGCDSTILINLSLEDGSIITEDIEACLGEIFLFPDGTEMIINQAVSQISTLTNQQGCDSIITTNITTKQSYQFTLAQMICQGDNYTFFDGTTAENIIIDTIQNSYFSTFNGCDSIITTALSVIPPVYTFETGLVCQGETYIFPDGTAIPSIDSEITYESTFTASNGCDSIVATTVAISPTYNNIDYITICPGESIGVNGIDLGMLENDTTLVFPGATAIGCDSSYTFNITVDNIITDVLLNQATATASAVDVSYQWLDCNNNSEPIPDATLQFFTPEVDGDYQVVLEGPTGCLAYSECVSIIGVNTKEAILSSKILIFPNPVQDEIQLSLVDIPNVSEAIVYDIHGKQVLTIKINTDVSSHDVASLTAGLYFIKLETEEGFGVKKFVKL